MGCGGCSSRRERKGGDSTADDDCRCSVARSADAEGTSGCRGGAPGEGRSSGLSMATWPCAAECSRGSESSRTRLHLNDSCVEPSERLQLQPGQTRPGGATSAPTLFDRYTRALHITSHQCCRDIVGCCPHLPLIVPSELSPCPRHHPRAAPSCAELDGGGHPTPLSITSLPMPPSHISHPSHPSHPSHTLHRSTPLSSPFQHPA